MVNLTTNSSGSVDSSQPNWKLYAAVETSTVVVLSFLALGTTIANGFTLYTIYKDPLKCFRTPLTIFITGIIICDFLTGLIVEPVVACLYAIKFIHIRLLRTIQIVAMITINTSFFIILALAIAQFVALRAPVLYERWLTNGRAQIIIGCIYAYSFVFSFLPEVFRFSLRLFFAIDLILNTTLVTVALTIIYILTYIVLKRKAAEQGRNNDNHPQVEKDFLKGTFLLTVVLIVTVWPFMIALYVWIFNPYVDRATLVQESVALIICENILYLKFLWDPLIFVMWVAKYRKAVVMVFTSVAQKCGCGCAQRGAGVVVYNRHGNEETRVDDVQEETIVDENVSEVNDKV